MRNLGLTGWFVFFACFVYYFLNNFSPFINSPPEYKQIYLYLFLKSFLAFAPLILFGAFAFFSPYINKLKAVSIISIIFLASGLGIEFLFAAGVWPNSLNRGFFDNPGRILLLVVNVTMILFFLLTSKQGDIAPTKESSIAISAIIAAQFAVIVHSVGFSPAGRDIYLLMGVLTNLSAILFFTSLLVPLNRKRKLTLKNP